MKLNEVFLQKSHQKFLSRSSKPNVSKMKQFYWSCHRFIIIFCYIIFVFSQTSSAYFYEGIDYRAYAPANETPVDISKLLMRLPSVALNVFFSALIFLNYSILCHNYCFQSVLDALAENLIAKRKQNSQKVKKKLTTKMIFF